MILAVLNAIGAAANAGLYARQGNPLNLGVACGCFCVFLICLWSEA